MPPPPPQPILFERPLARPLARPATRAEPKKGNSWKASRIAFLGDSLTEMSGSTVRVTTGLYTGDGYWTWGAQSYPSWVLNAFSGRVAPVERRYGAWPYPSLAEGATHGYGGNTPANLWQGGGTGTVAPAETNALDIMTANIGAAASETLVIVLAGTNDFFWNANAQTASATAANIITLWDKIAAKGLKYAAVGIPPGTRSGFTSWADRATTVNSLLAAEAAARKITFVSPPSVFWSGSAPNSDYFISDLVHFNYLGAKTLADAVVSAISAVVQPDPYLAPASGHASWANTDPYFANVANWTQATWPSSGTASRVIYNDAQGRWLRCEITGIDGAQKPLRQRAIFTQSVANLAADGEYRVVAKVRAAAGSFGGVLVGAASVPGALRGIYREPAVDDTPLLAPAGGLEYIARSERFLLKAGAASHYVGVAITGAGPVDFQYAGLVKEP